MYCSTLCASDGQSVDKNMDSLSPLKVSDIKQSYPKMACSQRYIGIGIGWAVHVLLQCP